MPFDGDPLAFFGKLIIHEHHADLLKQLPSLRVDPNLPDPFEICDELLRSSAQLKVGIIGAGIGGLYTALILDSLGIEYEILESSDRAGGRLSTYKFPNGEKYDYYEVGAMRFPLPKKDAHGNYKDGTMKRLGELIDYAPLNKEPDRLRDKLIPYYFTTRKGSRPGFYYLNGIREDVSSEPKGPFDAEAMNVDADYARAGADAINSDVINPFIRILINDLQTNKTKGWDVLKANDSYSVRAYMASKYLPSDSLNLPPEHLPSNVINWCALLGGGNGAGSEGYDRALTESVFESLAFAQIGGTDYGDVDWKCFEGGTETLSKKIVAYIQQNGGSIQFNKRVTAIGQDSMTIDHSSESIPCVNVTVNGTQIKKYSHVISTLPLPVLRTVDLNNAGLNIMQKNALRALNYGPSVKIGVLFKSNWWTTKLGIVGGQSFTDLPIRSIVYPSYGVDSDTPCKVLIASYTWTSDAYRLSALASIKQLDVLKELVLRNLAEAHGGNITYKFLEEEFVDMNVKDWSLDEHTMGAFAFFGPGEFEDLYASLNFPAANSRLHFAGEALSTRHAWVVGALDSAWKAVFQYLKITGQDDKIKEFKEIWGENVEWTCKSTLVDHSQYASRELVPDILDQHLGVVGKAVQSGVIGQRE